MSTLKIVEDPSGALGDFKEHPYLPGITVIDLNSARLRTMSLIQATLVHELGHWIYSMTGLAPPGVGGLSDHELFDHTFTALASAAGRQKAINLMYGEDKNEGHFWGQGYIEEYLQFGEGVFHGQNFQH